MNKKYFNITIFLISIILICIIFPYSSQSTFWGDDGLFTLYYEEEKLFDILGFQYGHGSGYLGAFINKFLSFKLPILLNIHPQEFINTGHNIIKGIFAVSVLLSITKFISIYTKSKTCFILCYLFIIGYFLSATINNGILEINYSFYRYFFSLLFFSYFWLFLYKNILSKHNIKRIARIIYPSFCGYILGTSIEISFFLSLFLIFLIILYDFSVKISEKITKKNFESLKYNLNKYFYIPALFLFTATIFFTSNEGFKEVAADRGMTKITISQDIINEFCNLYLNCCIKDILIYWIIFIILLITAFIIAIRKSEIKKIIFPLFLQFAIISVMFSLVLCGKTYDETTRDRFYLHHQNIIFLYKMLILYPMLICMSYIIKNTRKYFKKFIPIIIFIIFISYGTFSWIKYPQFKEKTKTYYKEFFEIRKNMYISEKMLRFYTLQNQTAILDEEIINNYCHTWIIFGEENNYIESKIVSSYYPQIYGKNIKNLGFKLEKNALEKFYEKGGTFTEQELNELNFEHLKDVDFVLNKKEEG